MKHMWVTGGGSGLGVGEWMGWVGVEGCVDGESARVGHWVAGLE